MNPGNVLCNDRQISGGKAVQGRAYWPEPVKNGSTSKSGSSSEIQWHLKIRITTTLSEQFSKPMKPVWQAISRIFFCLCHLCVLGRSSPFWQFPNRSQTFHFPLNSCARTEKTGGRKENYPEGNTNKAASLTQRCCSIGAFMIVTRLLMIRPELAAQATSRCEQHHSRQSNMLHLPRAWLRT